MELYVQLMKSFGLMGSGAPEDLVSVEQLARYFSSMSREGRDNLLAVAAVLAAAYPAPPALTLITGGKS